MIATVFAAARQLSPTAAPRATYCHRLIGLAGELILLLTSYASRRHSTSIASYQLCQFHFSFVAGRTAAGRDRPRIH